MVREQWEFWETTFSNVARLDKIPKDPLTDKEYTYSVTNTKQEYEIACLYEWDDVAKNTTISQAQAWDKTANARVTWNYNWKIAKVFHSWQTYILAVPTIISWWWTTVEEIMSNGSFVYTWYKNLPMSYSWSSYNNLWETWWLGLVNSWSYIAYSWSLSDLKWTDPTHRLQMLEWLKQAYSWTLILDNASINEILSITDFTTTNEQAVNIAWVFVNNTLWGSIATTSNTTNTPETPPVLLLHADWDASDSNHIYTTHWNPQILSNWWQFDWAMSFDWVDDYITIADSDDFDFWGWDFTIDSWVYLKEKPSNKVYQFAMKHNWTVWWYAYIDLTPVTWVGLTIASETTQINEWAGALSNWEFNKWYHIAISVKNGIAYIYKNGILVWQGSLPVPTDVTNDLFIWRHSTNNTLHFFNGYIDEFRITKWQARYDFDMWFNAVTYTGNWTTQSVTWVWFQPDLVWYKQRDTVKSNYWVDSSRGAYNLLNSNDIIPEITIAQDSETFKSFDFNWFTLWTSASGNQSWWSYVSWNWKEWAQYGFDIVEYTGDWVSWKAIPHNLWVEPSVVIVKKIHNNWADIDRYWAVYNKNLWNDKHLMLNESNSSTTNANLWDSKTPDQNNFYVWGTPSWYQEVNYSWDDYIAYVFAEKTWFSKFGSYIGNGSTDGPEIDLWFKPAFVIVKKVSDTGSWNIFDNARNTSDTIDKRLFANLSDAEYSWTNLVTFLSNWFKLISTASDFNSSWWEYIYMAFANGIAETFTPATSAYTTDINTKLLLHFDWDGSPSKHDLTFNWWVKVDASEWKFNWSYSFDWVDDYVSIPDSDDFAFWSEDFTIDMWVKNNTSEHMPLLMQYIDDNNRIWLLENHLWWWVYAPNFSFTKDWTNEINLIWSESLWNWWQHVAVVRNNDNITLYKNGISIASDIYSGGIDNLATDLNIWKYTSGFDYWATWNIDELRISQWTARWTENFTPDTSPY